MRYVPGPDWPGGGIIIGRNGIREAYETGRGTLTTRSMTHFENVTARKKAIVVTELPFMVGPERVLERISEGVKNRKLEGISGAIDLTDRHNGTSWSSRSRPVSTRTPCSRSCSDTRRCRTISR